jgi:predicted dehydrogenase
MAEKINAALVGLDNPHSLAWLETLRHCEQIARLVVCDPEAAAAEGVEAVYGSLEDMLKVERPHFGVVCTRNDRAPGLAERLLEAGIPLIVEKPAARSAAQIVRLNQVASRCQLPWATGFVNRYHPVVGEFKRLVQEGALGRLVSIEGRMITSSVEQRDPGHWLFDRQQAGGGILHWLAIHTLDLIRYISGLECTRVGAQVATLSGTGIDVEDMAAVSFSMSNGALGTLHAGYALKGRYGDMGLWMRGTLGEAGWTTWGAEGRDDSLMAMSQAPGWEGADRRDIRFTLCQAPGYGGALGRQFIGDFIRAASGKEPFITNGEDALQALRFVEAAYRSSESGRIVEL